jgi:hypothetical protein
MPWIQAIRRARYLGRYGTVPRVLRAGLPASLAGDRGQDIGLLQCTEPAYIAHPQHAYAGIAPGTYTLRRQREQADEERFVAD